MISFFIVSSLFISLTYSLSTTPILTIMRSLPLYAAALAIAISPLATSAQTVRPAEATPHKQHSLVALFAPQLYRVMPGEAAFLANHTFHFGSALALFYQSNDTAKIAFRIGVESGYRENGYTTLAQPTGYLSENYVQIPVMYQLRYPLYQGKHGIMMQWALTGGLYYQVITQRTDYTLDPGTGNTINTDHNLPYGRIGSTAAFSVTLKSATNSIRHEIGVRATGDFKNQQSWHGGVTYHPAYSSVSLYYALVVPFHHHH